MTGATLPRPPGPRGPALLGLIPRVVTSPLATMCGLIERYGDVVCVGKGLFYLIWRPEHIEQVLVSRSNKYGKGDSIQTARAVFGDGLVTSDGEVWRRQRRVIQPAFRPQQMERLAGRLTEETERMLQRWETHASSGEPIDVVAEMMALLQQIIFGMMFSVDTRDRAEELTWAQGRIEEYIDRQAWNPFSFTEKLPTRRNRQTRQALKILEDWFSELIAARREALEDPADLLSALLASGTSDRLIRDEMMTIFFTGHGTITYALSWAWYLLARHPEQQQRLREEAGQAIGDRQPTAADLPALSYARRVFCEALRMYPPAWIFARTASADDELGGYHVPAGMAVLLPTYVTQRHPELWPDPDRFDPERFDAEAAAARPTFAWYPFGGGQRQCIGMEFAFLEAQLVLAMVARRFVLSPVDTAEIGTRTSTLLKPRGPIRLRLASP